LFCSLKETKHIIAGAAAWPRKPGKRDNRWLSLKSSALLQLAHVWLDPDSASRLRLEKVYGGSRLTRRNPSCAAIVETAD
jgi:hypothetical protein